HLRAEGGGEGDRGGVGAAAAEGGDVAGSAVEALEPGDDGDRPRVDGFTDAGRVDLDDAGLAVAGVGRHAGLAARVAARIHPHGFDGHGEEGHADALPRGEEHVEFAAGGHGGDLAGEVDELVGGVTHGG